MNESRIKKVSLAVLALALLIIPHYHHHLHRQHMAQYKTLYASNLPNLFNLEKKLTEYGHPPLGNPSQNHR